MLCAYFWLFQLRLFLTNELYVGIASCLCVSSLRVILSTFRLFLSFGTFVIGSARACGLLHNDSYVCNDYAMKNIA
jgi:hypothetical protein